MFRRLSLSYKIAAIVSGIIFISIFIFGIYFDSFLKDENLKNSKMRLSYVFKRLKYNIQEIEKQLIKSLAFVENDEIFLASVNLINNYQDKVNYNAILIDEEKKHILNELLKKVKLSLNTQIVLYDGNEDLVGYVVKKEGVYYQNFISYINGQPILFSKSENQSVYAKYPIDFQLKHTDHQELAKENTAILYKIAEDKVFSIISCKNIFDPITKKVLAHIEMTYSLDQNYFQNISRDLNLPINIYMQNDKEILAKSLFDKNLFDDFRVVQEEKFIWSMVSIEAQNGKFYIGAKIEKMLLHQTLNDNRFNFLLLIIIVTFFVLILLRVLLKYQLVKPLTKLMKQIHKIEKHDYTPSKIVKTGDELEKISTNVNDLSQTINDREAQLFRSKDELEYLSLHDPLTNLPNRRYFYDKFEKLIESYQGTDKKAALIFIDLDQFKHINDTLGHDIGDKLLLEVSKILSFFLRPDTFLARLSGDEFNVLLQNINDKNDVIKCLNEILAHFQNPILIENHTIKTTASMGISLYPDDGVDTISLVKHADLAMYQAKDLGRNTYSFFSQEMADDIESRTFKINAMREALEKKKEFVLYYQPKVSRHTGKIGAIEALIRWNSDILGFVPPDSFIPLAEETALIVPLGEWILEKACSDFMELQKSGYDLGHISINVSGVQLENSDLLDIIKRIIAKTGISPHQIELEITESYIAKHEQKAIETLSEFRAMDIELAIDDFGTGYSSLSYLQKLPVTRLKIDKSFVDTIDTKESQSITNAIISLAKTFGLSITVEGVEEVSQLEFFHKDNCDEIQGYIYSKPLNMDEFKVFYYEFNNRTEAVI